MRDIARGLLGGAGPPTSICTRLAGSASLITDALRGQELLSVPDSGGGLLERGARRASLYFFAPHPIPEAPLARRQELLSVPDSEGGLLGARVGSASL